MRILFLSDGKSSHTIRWVNVLAKRGHEIHLACNADHIGNNEDLLYGVKQYKLPFCTSKGLGYFSNKFALKKIIKAIKPNIINAHYASGYGTLARLVKTKPTLLSVWGSDVYDFPYRGAMQHSLVLKNLKWASMIASTGIAMKNQVKKLYPTAEVAVTPFGVDLQLFSPELKAKKTKKPYMVFGIVKGLDYVYGVDTVIKAFHLLNARTKQNIRLRVYGDGELKQQLKQLVENLGLTDKVIFKGKIPNVDVPKALAEMDIFVLGSKMESFGVAAVEAMAMELPIVATKADGFCEVMEDRITGFLVPIDDEKAMAQKMELLLEDAELRKKMGKAGRKRVQELYDFEKNADEMERVYMKLNEESTN